MAIHYPLHHVLFLDIETVSGKAQFDQLPMPEQQLWTEKARFWMKEFEGEPDAAARCYQNRAAILAEFGQIIAISVGILVKGNTPDEDTFRLKSFSGDNEKVLIQDFVDLLNTHFASPDKYFLCGHNIKEFDIPYLCRRMLMLNISLPAMLDVSGKKPWEVKHLIDTLELWKFGDIKHYTSLKLLAHCLNVPSPKEDIDGSEVGRVYYDEQNLPAIVRYCERDVLAVAQVLRRIMHLPLLEEGEIHWSNPNADSKNAE